MTKKQAKSGRSGPPRKNAQSKNKGGGQNRNRNRNNNNNNRNRNNNGRRRYKKQTVPRKPKNHQTLAQKILSVLTFGLLGKPKPDPRKKDTSKKASHQNTVAKKTAKKKQVQRKAPEMVPVTGTRLYVGNLAYSATENDLMDLFRGAGDVRSAEVVVHRRTERSKGYAFIEMGSTNDAQRAVETLHDQDFMERKLVVSGAKSPGRDHAA